MIKLSQAVIVEGKYDKIKLSSVLDTVIIATNGFGIYKDKEKTELIRTLAKSCGIVILTDSDTAGFRIRNHIKGCCKEGQIINVFIPQIKGKEKRKEKPSSEGLLGVEGMDEQVLINALHSAGVIAESSDRTKVYVMTETLASDNKTVAEKADMLDDGLVGGKDSAVLRRKVLKKLGLPSLLSANTMCEVINSLFTIEEYKTAVAAAKATNN